MDKKKIFEAVVKTVEEVAEPREDWKVRNDEESVMCRAMVVNVLFSIGWTRRRISEVSGWKKSCVVGHINGFDARKKCSRILSVWYASVVRELRENPLFEGLL